jgi:uncharacterized membrane protein
MRIVVATEIDAPREVVWDYLMRRESWREFMDGVTRWEIQDVKHGVGARFAMRFRVGFIELGGTVEITEFDPPCDMAWTGVAGVDQRGRWRLRESQEGRTHAELRVTYHAPGGLVAFLADSVALPIVRGHLERSLAELKRRIEALPKTRRPGGNGVRLRVGRAGVQPATG